jgi:NAD(P)-dependent dehydrogenase (short-subunit alcohol dehydrogenase family)
MSRVAIITGASQGIGAGLADAFHRAGYVVVATSRTIQRSDEADEGMAEPIGRVGEVSDIVDGILYLERATFITGEILHIDGGQAAGH